MNILKIWKKKIIFGYYLYPSFEWPDMENAGFSVRLFANGTLVCQTYSLNRKREPTVKNSRMLKISEDSVSSITRILAGYAKEIDALPEFTNNGSCDGCFNEFVFCGKYVSSLNINRTDLTDVMLDDPKCYETFRFDMTDENTILDIFTKICEAMHSDGVKLYLYHLFIDDEEFH